MARVSASGNRAASLTAIIAEVGAAEDTLKDWGGLALFSRHQPTSRSLRQAKGR